MHKMGNIGAYVSWKTGYHRYGSCFDILIVVLCNVMHGPLKVLFFAGGHLPVREWLLPEVY
jgi:hypothetical protein